MSKKNKQKNESAVAPAQAFSHAAEYRIIKHDLFRVLALNLVYLALIIAVYLTNNQSHYLERWFGGIANI